MAKRDPQLLKPQQRQLLSVIPDDLSEREIAQYFTLSADDLVVIRQQRGKNNRLGFALQLCALRFPGRPLHELPYIPLPVLAYVAEQVGTPVEALATYAQRRNTTYDHLGKIRATFGYRDYDWSAMLATARAIFPLAMESDSRFPLVEVALETLRSKRVIAPPILELERLVYRIMQLAKRTFYQKLSSVIDDEQRRQLDAVLRNEPGSSGKTRLGWLKIPPKHISGKSLRHLLERIAYLEALALPPLPLQVPLARIHQLARRGQHYQVQAFIRIRHPHRRYAVLLAYLTDLQKELIDQAVNMLHDLVRELERKGERQQERHFKKNTRQINHNLHILNRAVKAFLQAYTDQRDAFGTVFGVVDEATLRAAVDSTDQLARPVDLDTLDLIEHRYIAVRRSLLMLYRILTFQPVLSPHPALLALDHIILLANKGKRVKLVEQQVKRDTFVAPLTFLKRTRWFKHVLVGRKHINPNYYEAAAFERLDLAIRAGDIAVKGSGQYQKFESDLFSSEEWQPLKANQQTRLAITGSATSYLRACQERIQKGIAELQRRLPEEKTGLRIDEEGLLHLTALETEPPEDLKAFRRRLYHLLPQVQLTDVLLEVDAWTGFLNRLTHLGHHLPIDGLHKTTLMAAILGLGMNLGIEKTGMATGFTYKQLSGIADLYIREETLLKAQAALDNFVLRQPLSQLWGSGVSSSSDGMRVLVAVRAPNAKLNARYFGYQRGVTILTHVSDIWMPFGTQRVISTNDREALYVIDALCNHGSDFNIQEHHTDHAGYTLHVFALCALLGIRFAPALRSLTEQHLYSVDPLQLAPPLSNLIKGTVDAELIFDLWDDILRLGSSIRYSKVPASLIMRKLAAYPRQNRLEKALKEMGKLERTMFILDYLLDETLRHRVRLGLNKGESTFSLARALFFGQLGQFHERTFLAQSHRASCLLLLVAAIGAWNTVYLQKAVGSLLEAGIDVSPEYLSHISPLAWEHINFYGQYHFDPQQAYPLDQLRALRRTITPEIFSTL